jgi:hypothetical protein
MSHSIRVVGSQLVLRKAMETTSIDTGEKKKAETSF